ncbi:hypothetical protein BDF22DRAFT_681091 [Syncephalis plumigaleata]|nr:hypothetical protein BDF22DRAFT_681091 [Syncephalis plumigaleata]
MSRHIGPTLPPHLAKAVAEESSSQDELKKEEENEEEDEEDESYGPSLPPELQATRQTAPRKVIGPAMPGTTARPVEESSDDSDDDVGPMPLPAEAVAVMASIEQQQRMAEIEARASGRTVESVEAGDDTASSKPTRGEWMLVPPTVQLSTDPLKKPSTGFRQTEGRGYRGPREEQDNFLWTESPAEREKRITRAQKEKELGRPVSARNVTPTNEQYTRSAATASRGPSLLEQHLSNLKDNKKETKKKRATVLNNDSNDHEGDETNDRFDRERDMAVQRVDVKRQRTMLQKGNLLNDRFSRGK